MSGPTQLEIECGELAGFDALQGMPEALGLLSIANLVSGTRDRNSPEWRKAIAVLWPQFGDGSPLNTKAQGDAWKIELVRVLLHDAKIPAHELADWWRGYADPDASTPKLLAVWLGKHLAEGGSQQSVPDQRRAKLRYLIRQLQDLNPDLNPQCMPGTRRDLLAFCKAMEANAPRKLFAIAEDTFREYMKGVCAFPDGRPKATDFYDEALRRLSYKS